MQFAAAIEVRVSWGIAEEASVANKSVRLPIASNLRV